jgi:hypothetical protein
MQGKRVSVLHLNSCCVGFWKVKRNCREDEQMNDLLTMPVKVYHQLKDWQKKEIMDRMMPAGPIGWKDSDGVEWIEVYLREGK